jgi:hypothetical protein
MSLRLDQGACHAMALAALRTCRIPVCYLCHGGSCSGGELSCRSSIGPDAVAVTADMLALLSLVEAASLLHDLMSSRWCDRSTELG